MPRITRSLIAGAVLAAAPGLLFAQDEQAQNAQGQAQDEQAQQGDPVDQYDDLLRRIDQTQVYNDLMQRQIEDQERTVLNIQAAMEGVPELQRQIPPLLSRMVDRLEQFVQLDLPFFEDERTERVAELQLMLEDPNVSVAQKMRRVLEAYMIEIEYGRNDEAYTGQLALEDGSLQQVNFLKLGRIAMMYQTNDTAGNSGVWDAENGEWIHLGSRHRNAIRQALRMANQTVAPELVLLPLTPPVVDE